MKRAGHTLASAAKTFIMVLSGIKNAKYLSLQHAGLRSYFTLTMLFLPPDLKQYEHQDNTAGQQVTENRPGEQDTFPKTRPQKLFQS